MADLAKLKVCLVAGTLGQGGAERQLYYILRALADGGARVRLLCLTRGEFWEDRIRDLRIPITWVGRQEARFLRFARIIAELRKDLPDVVQSQHFYTNLYVVGAARALGLREIGAVRNDGISEVKATGAVLGRLSLRAPRLLAANSRNAIRNAAALGVPSPRFALLPNIVDTDQFKPGVRSEAGAVRLLAAGRLVEAKRFDRFLSVTAALRRHSSKRIKAIIVGDGPLRSELEMQASALGLWPEAVEFRGLLPDMRAIYREADLFVLTSDWEGTPNVVLEAMASGLPVVATRVGGVPEVVRHGETGFLAEPADETALIRSLLTLVESPERRSEMGDNARRHMVNSFSSSRLPVYLNELYKLALA
jgi:glycosyltransferase involved in cell wall biosynthesis